MFARFCCCFGIGISSDSCCCGEYYVTLTFDRPPATQFKLSYSSAELRALNNVNVGPPTRRTRKLLFKLQLWLPAINRRDRAALFIDRSSDLGHSSSPRPPGRSRSIPGCKQLKFAELNVHSLGNKYTAVRDIILDYDLDVLVVCESWHVDPDDILLQRSTPPGYCCIGEARPDPTGGMTATRRSHGGGVVVY